MRQSAWSFDRVDGDVVLEAMQLGRASWRWGRAMSGNKKGIGSDLRTVDAHAIRPEEYDEAPELTDEQLARAEIREANELVTPADPNGPDTGGDKDTPVAGRTGAFPRR